MIKNKFPKKLLASCLLISTAIESALASILLEEVVVTAQKREQNLQDVGISITAFSGEQMSQVGFDNAQQITALVPGATTIQPNGPSSFFTSIRGVGQNDFSGDHQESPVAVYVDEAYISAASGAGFQLFDMERAEVLRGPQGTLFGRNATGGLVHYITRKPSQEADGYVDFTYGDYDQVKLEGAVGGGLTDTVSARLAFVRNKHDAYIENRIGTDLNNGDDWALRGHLLFEFDDTLNFLLSVRAGEQDIKSGFFEHSSARDGKDFSGPDLQGVGDSLVNGFQESGGDVFSGAYDTIGFNKVESQGVTGKFDWDIGELNFVSITDYWTLEKDYLEDSDASPNPFFSFFLQSDLEQLSQEFRLSGETDTIQWVTGLYYLNIEGDFVNGGNAANFFRAAFPGFGLDDPSLNGLGLYNPFSTKTESTAVFGQLEMDLSESLSLHIGARWSNEKKQSDYAQYVSLFDGTNSSDVLVLDAFGGGPLFVAGPAAVNNNGAVITGFATDTIVGSPDDAKSDNDLITAKLQLDWTPREDTLVYLSYNRGVKAGGYNAPLDATGFYVGQFATSEFEFDEEILNAFEVGFKWESSNAKYRLNGSAYYYDYQDYQAFELQALTTIIFNTDAEVKGFELEAIGSPLDGLDVLLGFSYIDNTVKNAFDSDGDGIRDSDRTAVLTPDFSINALVRYEWEAFGGFMAVQADANYLDDHYFQLLNSPVGTEEGYLLGNVRASYTTSNEQWVFSAFVNNVTDKQYRTTVFDLSGSPAQGGFGLAENYYGLPRWWGVTASYRWGDS
jgi:iron complex outermembrane recepter protein